VDLDIAYVGMLLWLYMHVSRAYFKCFICFSCMLQMFHLFVSKVDWMLHVLQCALVASEQRPAAAAWCCTKAPPWFTCGRKMGAAGMVLLRGRHRGSHADAGRAVPDAGAQCDASGHRV
jgi:hypothetical protein